jgi:hypothetical protein
VRANVDCGCNDGGTAGVAIFLLVFADCKEDGVDVEGVEETSEDGGNDGALCVLLFGGGIGGSCAGAEERLLSEGTLEQEFGTVVEGGVGVEEGSNCSSVFDDGV